MSESLRQMVDEHARDAIERFQIPPHLAAGLVSEQPGKIHVETMVTPVVSDDGVATEEPYQTRFQRLRSIAQDLFKKKKIDPENTGLTATEEMRLKTDAQIFNLEWLIDTERTFHSLYKRDIFNSYPRLQAELAMTVDALRLATLHLVMVPAEMKDSIDEVVRDIEGRKEPESCSHLTVWQDCRRGLSALVDAYYPEGYNFKVRMNTPRSPLILHPSHVTSDWKGVSDVNTDSPEAFHESGVPGTSAGNAPP